MWTGRDERFEVPFPRGNRLLDALPPSETDRLSSRARLLTLKRTECTAIHDTRMLTVDFPVTALMSVMGTLESGVTFEVASVGTEGFVEVDAALESDIARRSASCQFSGDVVRMPLEDFQDGLMTSREFARLVRRAVRARVFLTEQSVMCNLKHTVVSRLARWLLTARDRLTRTDFPVTHEFLAMILGARRASVSVGVAALQRAGAVDYERGSVTISDVNVLASLSCECYAAFRDAIEESLAPSQQSAPR
jgi:CRP-like cAMP-binding protein